MVRKLWIFVGIVVAVLVLWTAFTLTWSYSSGERAGYVQKFSEKGWICKTWEGEMAMVTMPGTVSEKFLFTVRSDEVAEAINATVGSRVVLTYDEHRFIPISCFGDTGHFVTGVKTVADAPLPGAVMGF